MQTPSSRNCYCDPTQPDGFCGTCERCGRPGHVRHAPNGIPYTGSWCDRCYAIVKWQRPGCVLLLGALIIALFVWLSR